VLDGLPSKARALGERHRLSTCSGPQRLPRRPATDASDDSGY
jgi:hypothetical protein